MSDPTIKYYNFTALMRMRKVELLAIMDELNLDVSLLSKDTKEEMSKFILNYSQYVEGRGGTPVEGVISLNPLTGRPNIPPNTMIGAFQQTLRSTNVEKSVRIKRIEESQRQTD